MIGRLKSELKIAGSNLYLISAVFVVAFIFLAWFGGDLLNLSILGFEVIFPFFTAIAVGEWGKTRADENYDVIVAQSKSLFGWVITRYVAITGTVCVFAVVALTAVTLIRGEMPIWEVFFIYFPTAFFLSSISSFVGVCHSQEHIATLVCGVFWLISLMVRSLLRFPGIQYIYLFIRFAEDQNGIWIINKAILCLVSLILWGLIFLKCKKQRYKNCDS